jgi:hypothetical protein
MIPKQRGTRYEIRQDKTRFFQIGSFTDPLAIACKAELRPDMSIQYAAVRRAFEYLESLEPLDDQDELDCERLYLMENPTKQKAAEMYKAGIRLWFYEHGNNTDLLTPRAAQIRQRYQVQQ